MNLQASAQINTEYFDLDNDISQLKKVVEVNATEAVVFYTGRILEATSTFCVTRLGEKAKSNVFANIEYINDYNLLDNQTRNWAHALRRLANQFRHILKPTDENDGRIAIILLDIWLDWLLKKSKLLESNTKPFSLLEDTHDEIAQQFNWISEWLEHKNLNKIEIESNPTILHQPVFASVICEELINRKEMLKVSKFLNVALQHNPDDLRLNQLKGLLLSRTGRLKQAEQLVRKLLKQAANDDESIGILAGIIKNSWRNGDQERLNQWGKLYLKGWELSKQRNTYLGINAAAFCLWSGDLNSSKKIAKNIVKLYIHREKVLKDILNISTEQMDYWDHATLAEAYLLSGSIKTAEKKYHSLFHCKAFQDKPHEIPAIQLKQHLAKSLTNPSQKLNDLVDQYCP